MFIAWTSDKLSKLQGIKQAVSTLCYCAVRDIIQGFCTFSQCRALSGVVFVDNLNDTVAKLKAEIARLLGRVWHLAHHTSHASHALQSPHVSPRAGISETTGIKLIVGGKILSVGVDNSCDAMPPLSFLLDFCSKNLMPLSLSFSLSQNDGMHNIVRLCSLFYCHPQDDSATLSSYSITPTSKLLVSSRGADAGAGLEAQAARQVCCWV